MGKRFANIVEVFSLLEHKKADKFAHKGQKGFKGKKAKRAQKGNKAQNEGLLRNRAYVRHFANILALKAFFGLYGLAHVNNNKKSGTQAFHSFCFYYRQVNL